MMRRPINVHIDAPTRTEYVTRTVHEHRAPTDQSVALLKEMEQAARDKIEHAVSVGDNGFECVVHINWDALNDDEVAVAIFKLNGQQMRATARVRRTKENREDVLISELRDAVAKEIANNVVMHALKSALWPPRR